MVKTTVNEVLKWDCKENVVALIATFTGWIWGKSCKTSRQPVTRTKTKT
jgi:hypothetical protein